MVFDITQLKKIRKQLDLTQHQFAQKAGMSQSMITKIEARRLDPTYTYVKKIEEAIEQLTKHIEKEAKDIMCKQVITVGKKDKFDKIIKLFVKHKISQVPVLDSGKIIGLVTESCLVDHAEEHILKTSAEEIMVENPPIITKNAKLSMIIILLKFYSILLIQEKGKLKGVVTKADIITHL
tara:strand:- start:38145 stop:38684 length:540 start_codon:yes stop_codon:yes gene_type:complete